MALNVGQDFKKRWLDAPEAVRQAFIDDLTRITELFDHKTQDIRAWIEYDQRSMQVAGLKVEQAYADLKAQLIEEARVRKQLALETALAEKRAKQTEYNKQLQIDEAHQYQAQTEALMAIRQNIDLEIEQYTSQYTKNPVLGEIAITSIHSESKPQIQNELENIKIMLELEFEEIIEQAVSTFREKLQSATQEEIDSLLTKISSHIDKK
ncbi:hypothetical protein KPC_1980 [Acinetobacter stercoris]|uniref:PspA/IM30 family protein n=1 Tax=Acinetobacter stercoris TaxID=2126983 RepID=A0A2U3MZF5_9GAMM|nr:hypothetical protein KPC_1980 [Acinetobacter stercoris]